MTAFNHQPHNWLIHKLMWERLCKLAPDYARGILLDIGSGNGPYKNLFMRYVSHYFGLDFSANGRVGGAVDVYADAQCLPIASGSVDTILCSEVLEHLPLPMAALQEAQRVLKPGGHIILTTPLFWHLHEEPRDYYRYTKYGLKYLFETSGLKILYTAELTGFLATFIQLGCYRFRSGGLIASLSFPLIWILQRLAYLLNKIDRSRRFSCLTIMVGQKADAR